VKGQGLEKLMARTNFDVLGINFLVEVSNQQVRGLSL
jgi:hypothetical protein